MRHPVDAAEVTFTINGTTPTDSAPPSLIQFNGMAGLSGNTIGNDTGVNLTLSVSNGELRPEARKDMYVLSSYRIAVNR
jgi:hypothetical protein